MSTKAKRIAAGQAGFTLIELIVVIVIIGILAAIAIPKYVDLTASANTAATQGVASNLSAAAAIDYANKKTTGGTYNGTCAASYFNPLLPAPLASDFSIAGTTPNCTVQKGSTGTVVSFSIPQ